MDAAEDAGLMGRIPITVRPRPGAPDLEIGFVDDYVRHAVVPVTWQRHYFRKCESWTMDMLAWRKVRSKFDIAVFRLTRRDGSIACTYRIAAGSFESGGHSSYHCWDEDEKTPEKWHCPKSSFQFDPAGEAGYPMPADLTSRQATMFGDDRFEAEEATDGEENGHAPSDG